MKLSLVNPPRSHHETDGIGPPLGLIRLARIAQELGIEPILVDLNLEWHRNPLLRENFYNQAVSILKETGANCYGFTSMGADSHIALELAKRIKQEDSETIILVGGPHLGQLENYLNSLGYIDHVIQGEGESQFTEILTNGSSQFKEFGPCSPLEANGLIDLNSYFEVNESRQVDFEGARGCKYNCSFCYSPNHYSRVKHFSLDHKLSKLEELKFAGVGRLFFVEDNFLNDEGIASAFCKELTDAELGVTWECYATLPDLTSTIISRMSGAGCRGIFLGVDAVTPNSSRRYRKKFDSIHTANTLSVLPHLMQSGIRPTCAFILTPPINLISIDEFEQTICFAVNCAIAGANIRLNPLAIYEGSDLNSVVNGIFSYDILRAELLLDLPPPCLRNKLAEDNPKVFPFHTKDVPFEIWSPFIQGLHVLFTLINAVPNELKDYVDTVSGSYWGLVQRILEETGPLEDLPKIRRRSITMECFVNAV